MYAGVNSTFEITSSVVPLDNDCLPDIPEWKKILIMKKRAGITGDEFTRRNLDSSACNINSTSRNGGCSNNTRDNNIAAGGSNKFGRSAKAVEQDFREISPLKTVTIGNINIELRSVKAVPENQHSFSEIPKPERSSNGDLSHNFDNGDCQDLQYGPGIVDRLRARFLNMGLKEQTEPVVRRFSSLENLPVSNVGPYRVNARGFRQNGFKPGTGNVKKAQSMETLICTTHEQQVFTSSRRLNARYVGGVKGRVMKNISPVSVLTDENDEPKEKSPSPAVSPRSFSKSFRRWDYNRSFSAPNINEDELPKPDTVKHVKKIFESPSPAVNCSEKPLSHNGGARFRKIPGTTTTSTSTCNNGAIIRSIRPAVKKHVVLLDEDCLDAITSAKDLLELPDVNTEFNNEKEFPFSPEQEVRKCDDNKINKGDCSPVLDDNLSANRSRDTLLAQASILSSKSSHYILVDTSQSVESFERKEDAELSPKVTPKQLPPLEGDKYTELLSQGSPVSQVELLQDEDPPTGVSNTADEGMVVASSESLPKKGGSSWQKAPPATTSVVFDFRGKDVKPNISLNPTPFGCRPAKVTRNFKRAGSPPRTGINREDPKNYIVDEEHQNGAEDEEDWDEMDIGADLPAVSGIVFSGENVKVGRGALLEKRNKKLSIQFDDRATSTFEYPSENASPREEIDVWKNSFNSATAVRSASNSRLGLSNYTPQVLSSNHEFELGVSQSNLRAASLPEECQKDGEDLTVDAIIPANPDDTESWSATETADILF